jgi:hypothetical protein
VRLLAETHHQVAGLLGGRGRPPGWTGYTGRINQALLADLACPRK